MNNNVHLCMHNLIPLPCTRKGHNIVNQLYLNKINFLKGRVSPLLEGWRNALLQASRGSGLWALGSGLWVPGYERGWGDWLWHTRCHKSTEFLIGRRSFQGLGKKLLRTSRQVCTSRAQLSVFCKTQMKPVWLSFWKTAACVWSIPDL